MELYPEIVDGPEFYHSQTKVNEDLDKTGILDMIGRVINPQTIIYIQIDNTPSHGRQS